jgi:hypothetical protein
VKNEAVEGRINPLMEDAGAVSEWWAYFAIRGISQPQERRARAQALDPRRE